MTLTNVVLLSSVCAAWAAAEVADAVSRRAARRAGPGGTGTGVTVVRIPNDRAVRMSGRLVEMFSKVLTPEQRENIKKEVFHVCREELLDFAEAIRLERRRLRPGEAEGGD